MGPQVKPPLGAPVQCAVGGEGKWQLLASSWVSPTVDRGSEAQQTFSIHTGGREGSNPQG